MVHAVSDATPLLPDLINVILGYITPAFTVELVKPNPFTNLPNYTECDDVQIMASPYSTSVVVSTMRDLKSYAWKDNTKYTHYKSRIHNFLVTTASQVIMVVGGKLIWRDGGLKRRLAIQSGTVTFMGELSDGRVMLSKDGNLIYICNLDTEKVSLWHHSLHGITAMAILPRDRIVIASDTTLKIYELNRQYVTLPCSERITKIFTCTSFMVTVTKALTRVWNLATLTSQVLFKSACDIGVCLDVGLFVQAQHNELRIWDVATLKCTVVISDGVIKTLNVLPDGQILTISDQSLTIWQ